MSEPPSALAISNRRAVSFSRVDRPVETCAQARAENPSRRAAQVSTVRTEDVVASVPGGSVAMQSELRASGGVRVYYGEPSLISGRRGVIFALVILAHIGLAYLLATYLGRGVVRVVIPPVMVTQIDVPKAVDKPEVSPPKVQKPDVYAPIPEYVDVEASIQENAITTTTAVPEATPAAAPVPPHEISRTGASVDPRYPLHIGEEYYPDASKRAGEEGACRVEMHVMANGSISDATIVKTSGFSRLDAACLKGVLGQRMLPATEDGKPVDSTTVIRIHWSLRANR